MDLVNYSNFDVKLNKQLNELKKCNAEIDEIFKDLDYVNLSNSSSSSFSSSSSKSSLATSSSFQSINPDKSSLLDQYNKHYFIKHCFHLDSSCDDSIVNSSIQVKPNKVKQKQKLQNIPKKQYKQAKIQFRYKLPYSNEITSQSYTNLNDLIDTALYQSQNFNDDLPKNATTITTTPPPRPSSVFSKKSKKSLQKPIDHKFDKLKPAWLPNGKFKQSNNLIRSASTTSIQSQKSLSSSIKSTTSNRNLDSPWRPNGKIKYNDPLLFSVDNLNIEPVKPIKKLAFNDPKDIGKGWKVATKIENKDELIKSTDLELKPQEKQIIKKKLPFKDDKDIGSGWKVATKIENKDELLKSTNTDLKLQETQVKKKLVIKDEKDIGDGWKPILGKPKSNENLLYESKEPTKSEPTKTLVKKDTLSKDFGKGWRPSGKTHLKNKDLLDKVVFYKPPTPDKPKTITSQSTVDLRKSAPINPWKPAMSKLKSSFPNTWSPGLKKAPIKKTQIKSKSNNPIENLKQEDFVTSTPKEGTPNLSKAEMIKNSELDESIIQKITDRKDSDNLSNNENFKNLELEANKSKVSNNSSKLKKFDTTELNEKIKDDDITENDEEQEQINNDSNEKKNLSEYNKKQTKQKIVLEKQEALNDDDGDNDDEDEDVKSDVDENDKEPDDEKQIWNLNDDDEE